jgi:hypothetical protein
MGMTAESLERAEQLAKTGLTLAGPTVELLLPAGHDRDHPQRGRPRWREQLAMAERSAARSSS